MKILSSILFGLTLSTLVNTLVNPLVNSARADDLLTPQTPSHSKAEQDAKVKAAAPGGKKSKKKPAASAQVSPTPAAPTPVPSYAPVPQVTPNDAMIRTPAKLYGSSYSIKITLSRDGFTYDIPVWVKPDQKVSSLDRDQMADLGWVYKDVKTEDVTMSGETLDVPKFANAKAEWAYVPDFSKSCCYGTIGQDILKDYEVRFDPNPPAHLEWIKITDSDGTKKTTKLPSGLAGLFSIHTNHASFGKKKVDLARTAYRLNLSKGELEFEPEYKDPKSASKPLASPIFQYEFVPPVRHVRVQGIASAYQKSAKAVGFKAGIQITQLNNVNAGALDRFEISDILTGRRSKTLLIRTDKSTYTFDFEKNEFTDATPVQAAPRRN